MLVPIGVAAAELGVHPDTLRRWEREGRIEPAERTPGGRRRYDLSKLRHLAPHKAPSSRTTIAYARVSTSGQKDDLIRQVALLESFCAAQGWTYEVITDVGSGLNYQKRGLRRLIQEICCEHFSCEVVIINASEDSTFEENLASDIIEIVTVFSARLYGSRSHKNRKVMDHLREVAEEVSS